MHVLATASTMWQLACNQERMAGCGLKVTDPGQVRHEPADKIRVVELRPLETVAGDHGSSDCGKREVNWSSDRESTNYHVRKYAE